MNLPGHISHTRGGWGSWDDDWLTVVVMSALSLFVIGTLGWAFLISGCGFLSIALEAVCHS